MEILPQKKFQWILLIWDHDYYDIESNITILVAKFLQIPLTVTKIQLGYHITQGKLPLLFTGTEIFSKESILDFLIKYHVDDIDIYKNQNLEISSQILKLWETGLYFMWKDHDGNYLYRDPKNTITNSHFKIMHLLEIITINQKLSHNGLDSKETAMQTAQVILHNLKQINDKYKTFQFHKEMIQQSIYFNDLLLYTVLEGIMKNTQGSQLYYFISKQDFLMNFLNDVRKISVQQNMPELKSNLSVYFDRQSRSHSQILNVKEKPEDITIFQRIWTYTTYGIFGGSIIYNFFIKRKD